MLTKEQLHQFADTQPGAMAGADIDAVRRKPRIPAGCDQQGRHPAPAEARTELGADDDRIGADDGPGPIRGVIIAVPIALMLWALLAAIWISFGGAL